MGLRRLARYSRVWSSRPPRDESTSERCRGIPCQELQRAATNEPAVRQLLQRWYPSWLEGQEALELSEQQLLSILQLFDSTGGTEEYTLRDAFSGVQAVPLPSLLDLQAGRDVDLQSISRALWLATASRCQLAHADSEGSLPHCRSPGVWEQFVRLLCAKGCDDIEDVLLKILGPSSGLVIVKAPAKVREHDPGVGTLLLRYRGQYLQIIPAAPEELQAPQQKPETNPRVLEAMQRGSTKLQSHWRRYRAQRNVRALRASHPEPPRSAPDLAGRPEPSPEPPRSAPDLAGQVHETRHEPPRSAPDLAGQMHETRHEPPHTAPDLAGKVQAEPPRTAPDLVGQLHETRHEPPRTAPDLAGQVQAEPPRAAPGQVPSPEPPRSAPAGREPSAAAWALAAAVRRPEAPRSFEPPTRVASPPHQDSFEEAERMADIRPPAMSRVLSTDTLASSAAASSWLQVAPAPPRGMQHSSRFWHVLDRRLYTGQVRLLPQSMWAAAPQEAKVGDLFVQGLRACMQRSRYQSLTQALEEVKKEANKFVKGFPGVREDSEKRALFCLFLYCYDLRPLDTTLGPSEHNLLAQLTHCLIHASWFQEEAGELYEFLRYLHKAVEHTSLPLATEPAYQILAPGDVESARQQYGKGTELVLPSFSSMTPSVLEAQGAVEADGALLRFRLRTGRNIGRVSCDQRFGWEEVVALPRTRLRVVQEMHFDASLRAQVVDLEELEASEDEDDEI